MANIGRNDPCPCGSGNKYKRCCLAAPTVMPAAVQTNHVAARQEQIELCDCCIDEFNERADQVLDELLAGHVDEAESLCQSFLRDFPGQAEGLDLLSMIFEERGQRQQALDLLRQASAIAHAHPEEYDLETRSIMRERLTELELSA
jgi:predicted Zn-dependent protease